MIPAARIKGWLATGVALAALATWCGTVGFDFVWDDQYFVVESESIRSLKNIPGMFVDLSAQTAEKWAAEFRIFRPLRNIHYALLVWLGGGDPQAWMFHLANVLWHAGTAVLLFFVLCRMAELAPEGGGRDPVRARTRAMAAACVAAIGFAVHPALSEAVSWVKCLDDIMAGALVLGSLLCLLGTVRVGAAYVASLVFFTLALYAKVAALPFAFASILAILVFNRGGWRDAARGGLPFFVIGLLYLAHRHVVIGQSHQVAPLSGTYGQTLLDMLPVVLLYQRLVLGVPPFRIDYSYMRGGYSLLSPAVWCGGLILLLFAVSLVLAWRSRRTRGASFGLAWFALFLLPVSNLVPMMQYAAERFLYLPMLGLFMAVGVLLAQTRRRGLTVVIAALVLLAWAALARQRSLIWRDPVTLFVTQALQGPPTERVERNAVKACLAQPVVRRVLDGGTGSSTYAADFAAVAQILQQLGRLFPDNDLVLNGQGILCARAGNAAQALSFFERACAVSPETEEYRRNRDEAMKSLREVSGESSTPGPSR